MCARPAGPAVGVPAPGREGRGPRCSPGPRAGQPSDRRACGARRLRADRGRRPPAHLPRPALAPGARARPAPTDLPLHPPPTSHPVTPTALRPAACWSPSLPTPLAPPCWGPWATAAPPPRWRPRRSPPTPSSSRPPTGEARARDAPSPSAARRYPTAPACLLPCASSRAAPASAAAAAARPPILASSLLPLDLAAAAAQVRAAPGRGPRDLFQPAGRPADVHPGERADRGGEASTGAAPCCSQEPPAGRGAAARSGRSNAHAAPALARHRPPTAAARCCPTPSPTHPAGHRHRCCSPTGPTDHTSSSTHPAPTLRRATAPARCCSTTGRTPTPTTGTWSSTGGRLMGRAVAGAAGRALL